MNKEDKKYHKCTLFDGHNSFPDIECIHCGEKYTVRVSNDPRTISKLYLHDAGLKIEETESELRISHEDIDFVSVISKLGTSATLGQATPTWKYIEYLKNNSKISV